jgi:hypothetical protein
MPDRREHRGKHPADKALFSSDNLPLLQAATSDLSWLLSRGYASKSALKLVGDRYTLRARQRDAAQRCACSDEALRRRRSTERAVLNLNGEHLALDGYNVLITVESALGGGLLFLGRDGCCRDLASLHGTYKAVEETVPAILHIGRAVQVFGITGVTWYMDSPVSNSGRLKSLIQEMARENGWSWEVELVSNADPVLAVSSSIVATSDSWILDRVERWTNLSRNIVELYVNERVPIPLWSAGDARA